MPEHLLFMPVHRWTGRSLGELAKELSLVPGSAFLLLDSSPDPGRWQEELDRHSWPVPVYHLTPADLHDLDADLLPTATTNYGKVANLGFLLAAQLGARTLTRRDVDEFVVDEYYPMPRDLELLEQGALLAGTTHFGDCDSDTEEIYAAGGPELMAELGELLNLELDFADPEVRRLLQHPRPEKFVDDAAKGAVYPGTSTVRDLFLTLPVSPADETPDVDNLHIALAAAGGWPMLCHGRVLEHRHDAGRDGHIFWRRLAQAIDYNQIMAPIIAGVGPPETAARHLIDGLRNRSPNRERRRETLERYARFLKRLPSTREVEIDIPGILDHQDRAAKEHLKLLERWPGLVSERLHPATETG